MRQTLILPVPRRLGAVGAVHGYGIARPIEKIGGETLRLNRARSTRDRGAGNGRARRRAGGGCRRKRVVNVVPRGGRGKRGGVGTDGARGGGRRKIGGELPGRKTRAGEESGMARVLKMACWAGMAARVGREGGFGMVRRARRSAPGGELPRAMGLAGSARGGGLWRIKPGVGAAA
jgi:hypothetical protein